MKDFLDLFLKHQNFTCVKNNYVFVEYYFSVALDTIE